MDLSIPKYLTGNIGFGNAVFSDELRDWKIDMPYLIYGDGMFASCSNLTSFSSDLPKLSNGNVMFHYCRNLTSFRGDLSSLTNGESMFENCEGLTSFSGDLSSLTNGIYMFNYCKLDAASVERILSTIPTYTDGSTHYLSLHFSSEAAAKFEEITGVTPANYEQAVSYKGWTIYAAING